MYRLLTGDKAYSSWTMRGWLLLAAFDIPFEDITVRMYDPAFGALRNEKAPARTVPILEWEEDGRTRRVWDSQAIAETLHERHPQAGIWPHGSNQRSLSRVLAAEMHSGFQALRSACPMNIHRNPAPLRAVPRDAVADVAQIGQLWSWALQQTGGPWLGGTRFSAADAFFAPVALRFEEYALAAPGTPGYVAQLLAHPSVTRWVELAKSDPRRLPHYDIPA
jgi:glutathione S-transferase